MKLKEKFNKIRGKIKYFYTKNQAEILLTGGIVSIIGGVITACIATSKLDDILDEHDENIKRVKKEIKNRNIETKREENKEITKVYVSTTVYIFKNYAPTAVLVGSGITMLLKSHSVMKRRNAAIIAAYETLHTTFSKYRDRVIDKYGREIDEELYYGTKKEKIEVERDENGKKKKVKEEIEIYPDELPGFDRYFDKYCLSWEDEKRYGVTAIPANFMFLKGKQSYCNRILNLHGFISLNDIYDQIGLPRSSAGQRMGWLSADAMSKLKKDYDIDIPAGHDFVDFGISDEERALKSVKYCDENGFVSVEHRILLSFNVLPCPIDKYIDKITNSGAFII